MILTHIYNTDEAFGDSAYRYSNKFLYGWRVFLTLSSTILSIATIIVNNPEAVENIQNEEYYLSCYLVWNNIVLFFLVLLDIIACVVNVVLFIIPLRKLDKKRKELENNINGSVNHLKNGETSKTGSINSTKNSNISDDNTDNNDDDSNVEMKVPDLEVVPSGSFASTPSSKTVKKASFENDKKTRSKIKKDNLLLKVAKKLTILTSIGVGSTFLSMLLIGIFSWATVWAGIDSIINIATTLLMFSWNKKYYNVLCKLTCCK